MKKILLLLAFIAYKSVSYSQVIVHLRTGDFVNTAPALTPASNPEQFSDALYNGKYYLWLQFNQLPTEIAKSQLQSTGVQLYDYLPSNTFIASFPLNYDYSLLNKFNVYAVTKPQYYYKIDQRLLNDLGAISWAANSDNTVSILASFISGLSQETMLTTIQTMVPGVAVSRNVFSSQSVIIKTPVSNINTIAAIPLIVFVEPIAAPTVIEDQDGLAAHKNNVTLTSDNYVTGRKLDGSGAVIALGDDGFIGPHIDFTGRIQANASNTSASNTHGDHTAGIILGAGNFNPAIRGQAPGATLRAYDGYNDLSSFPTIYTNNLVRITSHSLGQGCNSGYDSDAQYSDYQLRLYPLLMHVHSAGNSGTETCGGITGGWRTITGGFKAGKNVITVANMDKANALAASSSKGPTADGRIKPDITAVGTDVMSTQPNNTFASMSGTSMACPAIAGSLAVLNQAYNKKYNAEPNAGIIKAIALNTADDLGNAGPDFKFGWGSINMRRAVECIENGRFFSGSISQGATNTHTISIPANVEVAKIMVYWVDKEATVGVLPALVNDLDAKVISPTSVTNLPWKLFAGANPTAGSCNALADKGRDSLNNVEQVQLDFPNQGEYQLTVTGTAVPNGPQTYYVVYEYLYSNEVVVTHPFGGETFVPLESQRIRWEATGNTGTFALSYTVDDGGTWYNINSSVSASQRYYDWIVPNFATHRAKVRVTRGAYSDISDTTFVILNTPTNISFTQVCNGSSAISWNAVTGATGYDVYKLGTKYMELLVSTTNTSILLNNIGNSQNWYAVRATRGANANGRRSNAVAHTNSSSVACSLPVKLLSFTAANKNKYALLSWTVTEESGIQKYVVERASTPQFDDAKVIAETKARNLSAGVQEYSAEDWTIPYAGTWFYRLKTVEADKSTYSQIEALKWNSGVLAVKLYPNPAVNNLSIQFQQNYGKVNIEIFNIDGKRMLLKQNLDATAGSKYEFNTAGIASGNYMMVIKSSNNGNILGKEMVTVVK